MPANSLHSSQTIDRPEIVQRSAAEWLNPSALGGWWLARRVGHGLISLLGPRAWGRDEVWSGDGKGSMGAWARSDLRWRRKASPERAGSGSPPRGCRRRRRSPEDPGKNRDPLTMAATAGLCCRGVAVPAERRDGGARAGGAPGPVRPAENALQMNGNRAAYKPAGIAASSGSFTKSRSPLVP